MRSMKRREFLAAAALAPALTHLRTAAQESDEAGFVGLFDGTSLNGWSVADGAESGVLRAGRRDVVHESSGLPHLAAVRAPVRQYKQITVRRI